MTTPEGQQAAVDANLFQRWGERVKLTTEAFRHMLRVATTMVIDTLMESPRFKNWLYGQIAEAFGFQPPENDLDPGLAIQLRRRIGSFTPSDDQLRGLIRQVLLEEGVIQPSEAEKLADAEKCLQSALHEASYEILIKAPVKIDGQTEPVEPFGYVTREIAAQRMTVTDGFDWLRDRGYIAEKKVVPTAELEVPTFLRGRD